MHAPHPPNKPRHGESRGAFKRRLAAEAQAEAEQAEPERLSGWEEQLAEPEPEPEQLPPIGPAATPQAGGAAAAAFYRAVASGVVRDGVDRSSARAGVVQKGEVLQVLEVQTSRDGQTRIRTPRGWVSERASSGKALLVPCTAEEAGQAAGPRMPRVPDAEQPRKRRARRKKKKRQQRRQKPARVLSIADVAAAQLLMRRQRRVLARAEAPWRQPAPPLIRREAEAPKATPTPRRPRAMTFSTPTGAFSSRDFLADPTPRPMAETNALDTGRRYARVPRWLPRFALAALADSSGRCGHSTRRSRRTSRPPETPPKRHVFMKRKSTSVPIKNPLPYKQKLKRITSAVRPTARAPLSCRNLLIGSWGAGGR